MRHKLLSHLLAGAVAFGAFGYAQPAAGDRESGKRPPAPAGHFALEEDADLIAAYINNCLDKQVKKMRVAQALGK
jgi:hypothetical protein